MVHAAGVLAIAFEAGNSLIKIALGQGHFKDLGNVIVGVATGVAMYSGIGEAVVGTVSIAWGIYKMFKD
jgi:hypothetical protein